jgi:hypothetical protein
LVTLCALALGSLTVGALNALRPQQSQDVRLVREWSELWLWQGANPYQVAQADYPPNALVVLSSLTLLPEPSVAPLWIGLNLVLAPTAATLAWRLRFPWQPLRAAAVPALLFLSWAGLRIGLGVGQFHVLALTLGLVAVALSRRQPIFAGLLLGVALLKPHLALAFLLWALLTRRTRMVAAALLVVGLGMLAFCLRVGQGPLEVMAAYFAVLDSEVGVHLRSAGIDIRPIVHLVFGPSLTAVVAYGLLVSALLASVIAAAARLQRTPGARSDALILGLCCALVLLALPHGTYDIVLLLPALLWLWSGRGARAETSLSRQVLFWLVQVALVLDIPDLARRAVGQPQPFTLLLSTVDTAALATVFAYLLWTALATIPRPSIRPTISDAAWATSEVRARGGF